MVRNVYDCKVLILLEFSSYLFEYLCKKTWIWTVMKTRCVSDYTGVLYFDGTHATSSLGGERSMKLADRNVLVAPPAGCPPSVT